MADTGLGTKFYRDDEEVASVASITPPGMKRNTIEVDELSPENDIKLKKLDLIEMGEFTVVLNFDPGEEEHAGLLEDLEDGEENEYAIELPDGSKYVIQARVIGFTPQAITAGSVIQAEVTFDVTEPAEYEPPEEG